MLSIQNSILVMTALFNAGLAVFILRGNLKNYTNIFFGVFLSALSFWALALMGFQTAVSYDIALYFGKLSYAAALVIGASFYLFSVVFPGGIKPNNKTLVIVCFSSGAYIIALLAGPAFLIREVVAYSWGNGVVLGLPEYTVFSLIFCFFFVGGLARIWQKYFEAEGISKIQLLAIGSSVSIAGIAGIYYNLILASPFLGDFGYLWTGPLFTSFIAITIMYSVFRLHLFNAKVIATELLISLLWIFTLLRTLLALSPEERILNGGLFLLSAIIGSLLIKSVRTEVKNREETELLARNLEKTNFSLQERTVQLEKSKEQEVAKAKEVARLKDEFVFLAVHELRTPVTAIKGFLEMTQDFKSGFPKDVKENLDSMSKASEHLNLLINDILEIARSESGALVAEVQPNNLKPIIEDVLREVSSLIEEKNLKLDVSIEGDLTVLCDQAKTKEVLTNLVDNAIKYNKENGSIYVNASRYPKNEMIIFEIRDTGYGVPKNQQPKIFQKFFRAVTENTRQTTGTGLGLFISRMLVEKMGGKLMFSSVEGQGSTFSFSLPVAPGVNEDKKINVRRRAAKK